MQAPHAFEFVRFAGNACDIAVVIDADGVILATSQSVEPLIGYAPDTVVARNVVGFVHPDDVHTASNLLANAEERAGQTVSINVRVRHAAGHWVPFEILPLNLLATEGVIVLTGRDITDRLELERERRAEINRFRALAKSTPIAIFLLDLNGYCEFVNDRWTELAGQSLEAALGLGWIDVIERRDQVKLVAIRDNTTPSGELDLMLHDPHGTRRSVIGRWTVILDDQGDPCGFVGTMEDVTERKALEARLLHQATHDTLTGLPNRIILSEHLSQFLAAAQRTGDRIGVVFCDLDRFKIVNDSLGHETGDRLLVSVARRLTASLRGYDVVARFGGDEFVVLTSVKNESDIHDVTERLQAIFAQPFEIGIGRPYPCSASIGIALSEAHSTPETLLRDADVAMYRAKERGRGRSEQFDDRLRERAIDRMNLISELPLAISENQLVVLYQPIVQTSDGKLMSVEALMRWDHPTRGRLSPDTFIEPAEESGLILAFGDWILDQACTDLLDAAPINLNINLSACQVHDSGLVPRITESLNRTGFPPSRLIFEITESVLVHDIDATVTTLEQLKALGVSIAVDDFGTGYSSLNYLSRFPVDSLKIDRSFVQSLGMPGVQSFEKRSSDNEIVRSVIALAHALGMTATAEGVETETQLAHLAGLGCDFSQGYLFQEPQPISALRQHWVDRVSV
jgi:diguanylate cyclase (GGDEF)-like protein/PAS domain S-box-containing protein